jgi:hypothetical protein
MRIFGSPILLTLVIFVFAFSQQSPAPAGKVPSKTPPPEAVAAMQAHFAAKGKTTTPAKSQAIAPAKGVATKTSAKPRTQANPYAQKALAQASARMALQKKCDATYGDTIRKRTGDLQKQMMDLMQKERTVANTKNQKNANLRKMRESNKKLRAKDSLAYRDTTANRMQRRKDMQNERFAAMKKMRAEERKIETDPELVKIRQSIAAMRKQIEDSISVIIKNDPKCLSCYKSSR